nr:BMC domain-containing protein [uncultured Acetatifactor sp.]
MSSTSLGFIEITGVVAAIDALDIMCKTSGVELATWERKLGGRLVTIIVRGDVASVTEAVEAAAAKAIKKPVASGVIANPHEEIVRLVNLSASRFMAGEGHSPEEGDSPEAHSGALDARTIQEV